MGANPTLCRNGKSPKRRKPDPPLQKTPEQEQPNKQLLGSLRLAKRFIFYFEDMKRIFVLVCIFLLFFGAHLASAATVLLRIEGSEGQVFSGSVESGDCEVSDTDGQKHNFSGKAICALESASKKGGFNYQLKNFGFGLFLKQIASDDTPSDYSKTWSLWKNDDMGNSGVDAMDVGEGDRLLLTYSGTPASFLRVTIPENVIVNTPVVLLVEKRVGDFDSSYQWHGSWQAAAGANLHVGSQSYSVPSDGKVSVSINSVGEVSVKAVMPGSIQSETYKLNVTSAATSSTPSPLPSTSPTTSPTPASVTVKAEKYDKAKLEQKAGAALKYLKTSLTKEAGAMTIDWAAMAFGANGVSVLDFDFAEELKAKKFANATDVERRILAVRATGGDPRNFNGTNLLQLLKKYYSDGQVGEKNLINDDIFGVLAFLAAGEDQNSPEISGAIKTIQTKQKNDGSFDGGIDVTAAAIQALKGYQLSGGSINVAGNISQAKSYLLKHQDKFGGFGENSASTAWGIQAIVALGEDPQSWRKGEGNPFSALLRYQNANGAFGWRSNSDTSAYLTAYAAAALLKTKLPVTKLKMQVSTEKVLAKTVIKTEKAGVVAGVATAAPVPSVPPETGVKVIQPEGNTQQERDFLKFMYFSSVLQFAQTLAMIFLFVGFLRKNFNYVAIQRKQITDNV